MTIKQRMICYHSRGGRRRSRGRSCRRHCQPASQGRMTKKKRICRTTPPSQVENGSTTRSEKVRHTLRCTIRSHEKAIGRQRLWTAIGKTAAKNCLVARFGNPVPTGSMSEALRDSESSNDTGSASHMPNSDDQFRRSIVPQH